MPNLYDLITEYAALQAQVEEAGGDLTGLEERLDAVRVPIETKVVNLRNWIIELDHFKANCRDEEYKLRDRREKAEKLQECLDSYLKEQMLRGEIRKIKVGTAEVRLQKNNPAIDNTTYDEAQVLAKYRDIIPETTVVRKKDVLEDLKKGIEVPGAKLAKESFHLRLK